MTKQEKQALSETDIYDLFITPAIEGAGWDQLTQIRREVTLAPGPVIVRGNMSSRNKGRKNSPITFLLREARRLPRHRGEPSLGHCCRTHRHHRQRGSIRFADLGHRPSWQTAQVILTHPKTDRKTQ
jgi:hypothetical protein